MDSLADPALAGGTELENKTNSPPPASLAPENNSSLPATQADGEEAMDEDASAPKQASPAKGKAKARGRAGAGVKGKGKVAKPPPAKAVTTRGRRQKVYDNLKAQAAHERMQELKTTYATVAKFIRQPLQWLADKSLNKLLDDPIAHEVVPEGIAVQEVLDQRLRDTKKQADDVLAMELDLARRNLERNVESVNNGFRIKATELREQIHDGLCEDLLRRLDNLERLHDCGLPADLADAPDGQYTHKKIAQEEADRPGPYVEYSNGVEVPFHGRTITELMTKVFEISQPTVSQKRKAQGQPEGQPASKSAATAKDDEATPEAPVRHTGGLLSAVEALENDPESPPEAGSSAPTPAAEPLDEPSPENVDRAPPSSSVRPEAQDLATPRGASAPDEYGVRLISRRPTRVDYPNNRIMVPSLFEFEDHEIGFRDSTNSPQKGATKARRGKYLDKPNSNCFFIDRRVGAWDSTTIADDFDEEMLQRHKLHPSLGIFLSTSANEQEPASPPVTGRKPVVFTAPDGKLVHTSRSVVYSHNEMRIASAQRKMELRRNLLDFMARQGISEANIAPDEEMVEESRLQELGKRGIHPDEVPRRIKPQEQPLEPVAQEREDEKNAVEEKTEEKKETEEEETEEKITEEKIEGEKEEEKTAEKEEDDEKASSAFAHAIEQLLQAASAQEADVRQEAVVPTLPIPPPPPPPPPPPQPQQPPQLQQPPPQLQQPPPQLQQQSRPYDAVRDVFTDSTWSNSVAPVAIPEPRRQVDTSRLSMLADVSTTPPALLAPPLLPPVEVLARPNDFLRTALNPAPPHYAAGPLASPPDQGVYQAMQPAAGRTPFSDTGAAKSLPALRPVRSIVGDTPVPPPPPPPLERQESPVTRAAMVTSNSGSYYPPAPSRPFHNPYSLQEPGMSPMMPPQQPGPMARPYPMSPPPFHGVPNVLGPGPGPSPGSGPGPGPGPGPGLGPGLGPGTGGAPLPVSMMQPPQGPPGGALLPPPVHPGHLSVSTNSAPAPTPSRSRSGGSSTQHYQHQYQPLLPSPVSASAAKYRKLEPAPMPAHRLGYDHSQDLRTVMFDYQSQIKDYSAVEAPPRHGPTNIRGWSHNTSVPKKLRANSSTAAASKGAAELNAPPAPAPVPAPSLLPVPSITTADDQSPS